MVGGGTCPRSRKSSSEQDRNGLNRTCDNILCPIMRIRQSGCLLSVQCVKLAKDLNATECNLLDANLDCGGGKVSQSNERWTRNFRIAAGGIQYSGCIPKLAFCPYL
jgi:hypothetical protein